MTHYGTTIRGYGGEDTLKVLLDMDQVLCDCDAHFLEEFQRQFPGKPFIPLNKRAGFWMLDQYQELGLGQECVDVYSAEGFFAKLPPIPGAIEAAKELQGIEGVSVFICTSGIMNYNYSLREKFLWVETHLGPDWLGKIIILKDKTMACGHLLIDDRVDITGANPKPCWDHVIFSTYHNCNRDLQNRRVLHNWTDGSWRDLIQEYVNKKTTREHKQDIL